VPPIPGSASCGAGAPARRAGQLSARKPASLVRMPVALTGRARFSMAACAGVHCLLELQKLLALSAHAASPRSVQRGAGAAQYGLFNVTSYPVYNNCSAYAAAVVTAYPRTRVTSVDNVTVVARGGPDSVQLPVTRVGSQPPQQGARACLPAAACRGWLGNY